MGAAIEYATPCCGVRTITVCGHSGCGAMGGLLDKVGEEPEAGSEHGTTPHLDRWLRHGDVSLARFTAGPRRP